MFWMIIPHISILYGLLLSGSNLGPWHGIAPHRLAVAAPSDDVEANATPGSTALATHQPRTSPASSSTALSGARDANPGLWKRIFQLPPTEARYSGVWLWQRGCNKARWITEAISVHEQYMSSARSEILGHRLGPNIWWSSFLAVSLLAIPCFFGGLVRYV